ncbi:MAG: symmetrical bis(5'-nucleosyl)-tetraphosphatase [Proteobacteria bacterium]|nr:symmetrical bis(5'-nucleosyl)-tetraphosphatase [Pseudomonadota bacterium]
MAVYVIGDVQGCYSRLIQLLEKIQFDQTRDKLWFCGDLVNRGPDSLQTLRFVRSLGDSAVTVLGNHDLHLLEIFHSRQVISESSVLSEILVSPDCAELIEWLQSRPLIHYDDDLKILLVHAGIDADWSISQAMEYAGELEQVLRGGNTDLFFSQMYGDLPDQWSEDLTGIERQRCITNILTRLRFYTADGRLEYQAKGSPRQHASAGLIPWFEKNPRLESPVRIVFGHWSTLKAGIYGRHFAIDSGCVWGHRLIALRIDTTEPRWFDIRCGQSQAHK